MPATLGAVADLDQSARHPGGILARALAAPEGWTRGLVVPFYGCGEPIVRDKCVLAEDEAHRTGVATFHPFPIEQRSECSTLSGPGGLDHERFATDRLDATTEWAMGQQLAADVTGQGTPSLANATSLGTVANADFVSAVGCLEQAAADAGFGSRWVLHAPVRAAAFLTKDKMLRDGLSPTGATWIISPGYPVQGPTTVRLWATGQVWAAVDAPQVVAGLDHRVNTEAAYALRAGVVAFDPCLNFSIDVTVPACPTPPAQQGN